VLADMHAHYPMHVVSVPPAATRDRMRRARGRSRKRDKVRAMVLRLASRLFSDDDWWSGYRVTTPYLRDGDVRLVMSVLYRPFEEMDLDEPYGAPPSGAYFGGLLDDLRRVQEEVDRQDPKVIRVVTDADGLNACLDTGATALVHCVEGGFHLGGTTNEVTANIAMLAGRGVAYITLAHLFFRQVATNAPALPFLADPLYNVLFPQRAGAALTELGEAAVAAMVEHKVIVDISHMRADAIAETFALLNRLDPQCRLPVISSHAGYRFGRQRYMHDDDTIREIKRRDGVVGLIMAQHQLNDGLKTPSDGKLADSVDVISRHIDKIREITGSHRHVAIGSDFDGFIKPTMSGLEDMRAMRSLERELRQRYAKDADALLWENALRVLRTAWT
jgi:microsomal dipeptidase-like Zn-dependent dipeptidase